MRSKWKPFLVKKYLLTNKQNLTIFNRSLVFFVAIFNSILPIINIYNGRVFKQIRKGFIAKIQEYLKLREIRFGEFVLSKKRAICLIKKKN